MLVIVAVVQAGGAEAFTGSLIAYNTTSGGPKYTAETLGQSLPTLNTLGVFSTGAALGLIFGVRVWLIITGARPGMHHPTRQAARGGPLPLGSDPGAGHPRPT